MYKKKLNPKIKTKALDKYINIVLFIISKQSHGWYLIQFHIWCITSFPLIFTSSFLFSFPVFPFCPLRPCITCFHLLPPMFLSFILLASFLVFRTPFPFFFFFPSSASFLSLEFLFFVLSFPFLTTLSTLFPYACPFLYYILFILSSLFHLPFFHTFLSPCLLSPISSLISHVFPPKFPLTFSQLFPSLTLVFPTSFLYPTPISPLFFFSIPLILLISFLPYFLSFPINFLLSLFSYYFPFVLYTFSLFPLQILFSQ